MTDCRCFLAFLGAALRTSTSVCQRMPRPRLSEVSVFSTHAKPKSSIRSRTL